MGWLSKRRERNRIYDVYGDLIKKIERCTDAASEAVLPSDKDGARKEIDACLRSIRTRALLSHWERHQT